ncbi:AAA family ATPase [Glycomyces paridis]|uniref:ATP-binding protein n=1 Tax=Glycomyces paridis TaxID=2126555 RepID=A0A4S8PCQ8_9ACTN|nr:AAA family ATPase [Glycomyces paridis]THV26029.1 ATP-binding protein [Glycomyces paridis]
MRAPRLVHLNGAPAAGKSTLARRYAEDHPFALVLDLDHLRRTLGRWRDDPGGAGLLARSAALAAASVHLAAGYDVVVPQLTARISFVERMAATAAGAGARFAEVHLRIGEAESLRRFADRTRAAAEPVHVDAAETLEGGEDALRGFHAKVVAFAATRPGTITVDSLAGDVEGTYRALVAALG